MSLCWGFRARRPRRQPRLCDIWIGLCVGDGAGAVCHAYSSLRSPHFTSHLQVIDMRGGGVKQISMRQASQFMGAYLPISSEAGDAIDGIP